MFVMQVKYNMKYFSLFVEQCILDYAVCIIFIKFYVRVTVNYNLTVTLFKALNITSELFKITNSGSKYLYLSYLVFQIYNDV